MLVDDDALRCRLWCIERLCFGDDDAVALAPGAPALDPLIAPPDIEPPDIAPPDIEEPDVEDPDMSSWPVADPPDPVMLPPPAVLPVPVPAEDCARATPGARISAVAIKNLRITIS